MPGRGDALTCEALPCDTGMLDLDEIGQKRGQRQGIWRSRREDEVANHRVGGGRGGGERPPGERATCPSADGTCRGSAR